MAKRETLELVRAYYRIGNPQVRKRLFEMTKALAHEFGPAVITANTIPPRFISGTICLALRFSTSPLLRLPSAEVGQASKRLPALPMLNNDTSAYPL